ncbi:MAG TPA: serine/threonine-protein kinase [Planctomycetia bacterium]|nr:serine/threonine-protein kinase [Planctomycetia bacterium]
MAIGKFDVLGQIGRGAGSSVLKIKRHSDGKVYALKVVAVQEADDRRYVEQCQTEFDAASRFDHPNLCRAFELEVSKSLFGKITGSRLLLEFIDGKPLSEFQKLPIGKLLAIFSKVAAGLAHMHAVGFLHADVKPDNILVTTNGDVKLIDYGVAWRRGEKKERVQGTLEFLAPEQAKKRIVTVQTDIFNFGATMYRVFSGAPIPEAFHERGSSRYADMDTLVRPLTEVDPSFPKEVDELVRQCLRYKPDARPESVKAVGRALVDQARKHLPAPPRSNDGGESAEA